MVNGEKFQSYAVTLTLIEKCPLSLINGNYNNGSINFKFEHAVVYKNKLDEFNSLHCPIKIKVMV